MLSFVTWFDFFFFFSATLCESSTEKANKNMGTNWRKTAAALREITRGILRQVLLAAVLPASIFGGSWLHYLAKAAVLVFSRQTAAVLLGQTRATGNIKWKKKRIYVVKYLWSYQSIALLRYLRYTQKIFTQVCSMEEWSVVIYKNDMCLAVISRATATASEWAAILLLLV